MARDQSMLVQWPQYIALRSVSNLIHWFPVEQNLRTASSIGSLFYQLNRRRRERAVRNISLSFPHWSDDEVHEVARGSMQHMFQLFLVDAIATPRLVTPDAWPRYVRLGNIGTVLERLVRSEPMIFLTAHAGNWELLGFFLAVIGYPLTALARPLDNRLINDWLLNIREARGMRIITKWGGTPVLEDELRHGGRVAFIADQNAGDRGMFVPFFGRLASSYKSIALLAMRHRVPIVAGCAHRVNDQFTYELHVHDIIEPDDWRDRDDPAFYITARYNRAMQQMICMAPEQYLWLHRRWKSRPKFERAGEPIPARLVEKIRSLPWMTDDELALIIDRANRGIA